jgi:HD superfamily phosphohydrolase
MQEKQKIIYDLIHGYIKITDDVEDIINDESFQRLKHIRQTTSYHLYPSTNHTRFEHSLGVMKLADDFFTKLKDKFKQQYEKDSLSEDCMDKIINSNYYHLIFASLLHDVGHAPLSHLCEDFYPGRKKIQKKIKERIIELQLGTWDYVALKKGNRHEWMSCLVIICNLHERLKKIFSKHGIEIDYEYITRIITGNKYEDYEDYEDSDVPRFWDRDVIISIVNSETIDVDKLDYMMRDNHMSGMVGPNIDIDRLLHSLVLTKKKELGFSKAGVSAIQKIIECRDSIYLWVCNHHTVVYTDYLLHECINHMGELYKFTNSDKIVPEYINRKRISSKIDELMQYYDEYNRQEGTLKIKNNISQNEIKNCAEILRKIGYLPYKEAFNKDDYFSIDAILKKKITDNEINGLINRAKYLAKNNELSAYTERLINQLVDRKFLKPIWKTLYEYQQFIETHFSILNRKQAIDYIAENASQRNKIVAIICERTGCKRGEVFLIAKENKFYLIPQLSEIYIYSYNRDDKENINSINKLLPQKDYSSMYNEITFYLYCKADKIFEVSEAFENIMNDHKKINFIYSKIEEKPRLVTPEGNGERGKSKEQ